MRKVFLTSFLLSLFITTFAGEGKSFISLRSGVSMPFGDYSRKSIDNGCFTMKGVSLGAEGAWYFWKNLGVGIDVNYSIHPVDAVGLATEMVRVDPFLLDVYVRSDPYTMLTILGGFYYSYSLTQRITLQPKVVGGVIFGKTPFQLFEPTFFLLGPAYFKTTSSRDRSFAFKPGISINYHINNCIALGMHADYTMSNMAFGFYTHDGLEIRKRKIRYLDIGLGLTIKL